PAARGCLDGAGQRRCRPGAIDDGGGACARGQAGGGGLGRGVPALGAAGRRPGSGGRRLVAGPDAGAAARPERARPAAARLERLAAGRAADADGRAGPAAAGRVRAGGAGGASEPAGGGAGDPAAAERQRSRTLPGGIDGGRGGDPGGRVAGRAAGAGGGRRSAQHLHLGQRARVARAGGGPCRGRAASLGHARSRARALRAGLHGHHDARVRRLSDAAGHARAAGAGGVAGDRADRESHARRPRALPRGRRQRLPGQAGRDGRLARADPDLAARAQRRRGGVGSMSRIPRSLPILAVDDEPANLLAVEAVLAELDEEVVAVPSGREALRVLLDRDFAVVLMDALMPEMDGFTTARLIRKRPRSRMTPIIFLTALRAEDDLFKAYDLGAVDYLFKPVVPHVLRAKVRFFLELAESQQQLRQAHAELEQFAA